MILLDTSGLLAALDSAQRRHRESAASLTAATPPLLLSPFVLAELDYLLATRVGAAARMSLLGEVERDAYDLQPFTASDIRNATAVIKRDADLGTVSPTRRSSSSQHAITLRTCSHSTNATSASSARTASPSGCCPPTTAPSSARPDVANNVARKSKRAARTA